MEEPKKEDIHRFLFMTLVSNFQMSAMQSLGKMKNPMTDKIERDLKQAKMSIDMLEMLKSRTSGNLDDDENKLITQALSILQLNYVDELKKETTTQSETPPKADQEKREETPEKNDSE